MTAPTKPRWSVRYDRPGKSGWKLKFFTDFTAMRSFMRHERAAHRLVEFYVEAEGGITATPGEMRIELALLKLEHREQRKQYLAAVAAREKATDEMMISGGALAGTTTEITALEAALKARQEPVVVRNEGGGGGG